MVSELGEKPMSIEELAKRSPQTAEDFKKAAEATVAYRIQMVRGFQRSICAWLVSASWLEEEHLRLVLGFPKSVRCLMCFLSSL
jgi:hypothetical protein